MNQVLCVIDGALAHYFRIILPPDPGAPLRVCTGAVPVPKEPTPDRIGAAVGMRVAGRHNRPRELPAEKVRTALANWRKRHPGRETSVPVNSVVL